MNVETTFHRFRIVQEQSALEPATVNVIHCNQTQESTTAKSQTFTFQLEIEQFNAMTDTRSILGHGHYWKTDPVGRKLGPDTKCINTRSKTKRQLRTEEEIKNFKRNPHLARASCPRHPRHLGSPFYFSNVLSAAAMSHVRELLAVKIKETAPEVSTNPKMCYHYPI